MNPIAFLVDTLIQLYTVALMLRLILQYVRADFYNPVSQFIVKITSPVVNPLRRIIPGLWGIDLASLVAIIVLTSIKIALVYGISGYQITSGLIILGTVLGVIDLVINVFLYSIIAQAILSWVNPDPYHPVSSLLNSVTWPIMKHFRKLIPSVSGFDISPIFAIIALMFLQQTIHYLLKALAG